MAKAPEDPTLKEKFDKFTRMMWKSATKVGFGIRDDWVFAWYCEDAIPSAADEKDYEANILPLCIKDGYNECYNKMALEAHNQRRVEHKGYSELSLDVEISKAIQKEMDKAGFAGVIVEADKGIYSSCGENTFG